MKKLRARIREMLNLDGPWVCVSCQTWTLIRVEDENGHRHDRCISCGRGGCPCFDGMVEWCDHHGHLLRPTPDEIEARRLSRRPSIAG